MKKGRHRRYEEARKFQRATAERFTVEDYDFDNSDRFGVEPGDHDMADEDSVPDDQYGHLADKYDDYSDLEAKYADFDADADADEEAPQRESA